MPRATLEPAAMPTVREMPVREVPGDLQSRREVPGTLQIRREVPGDLQSRREVPGDLQRDDLQSRREVPGTLQMRREVPGTLQIRSRPRLALLALLAATTLGGCAGAEALRRHEGPRYAAETHSWVHEVMRLGGNGMWLVVRGYHTGDDVVAVATNAPLSHAAILDHDNAEIIEAVGDGVRVVPLAKLLRESHRLQIVRPAGWTEQRGAEAVQRARSQVGRGYDFLGVVGAPDRSRWYCSELAAWSMGVPVDKLGAWHVIHPKDLHRKGALLFDSLARDGRPDRADPPAAVEAAEPATATAD